jgi:hypothetical protein
MDKIDNFINEYEWLSNFYNASLEYNGRKYLNSEAAFQSMKSSDPEVQVSFCDLNSYDAKKLGEQIYLREDWDSIKTKVMFGIVKAKFDQNSNLRKKLVDTGDIFLEEGNTWGDRIWGTVDGLGENRLGKILMNIRKAYIDYDNGY